MLAAAMRGIAGARPGKWKGITGGGEFVLLMSGKPIVAGTGQGCGRATGAYELSGK
jgi:hypothetical protein